MSQEKEIKLDQKVKDSITGYVGIVTGLWISKNNPRANVEGLDNNGRPVECWFDVSRLSVV